MMANNIYFEMAISKVWLVLRRNNSQKMRKKSLKIAVFIGQLLKVNYSCLKEGKVLDHSKILK